MSPTGGPPLASVEDVWKSYGGVAVLKGVSLDLMPGEIHGLVGGNGAGKSTLMKALTGVVTPDAGTITVGGRELRRLSPRSAHENGIYMVPQEPQLFPTMSVRENIALSLEGLGVPKARVKEVVEQMAPHIDLNEHAGDLSISDQQLVEIVRGMLRDAKVLIVDEPTASLTVKEADRLFAQLRELAASGVGIFYISHRMNEIVDLCDTVTVLRDGNLIFTAPTAETCVDDIVELMIPTHGADGTRRTAGGRRNGESIFEEPVLKVRDLTGQGFHNVSFTVHRGEIVGIAGVVGSGRTELAETIYGIRPGAGSVELGGKQLTNRTPSGSLKSGLSYVPEDRHAHGVFLLGSIIENSSASILPQVTRAGMLKRRDEYQLVEELTDRLDLQKGGLQRAVGNLSGGNQQKVSLAKALANRPSAIILDEPSRGVDVGARGDLYRLIGELAAEGTAVLVISSDFEEVVEVADRVLIMCGGTISCELRSGDIILETVRDRSFGLARKAAS